MTEDDLSRSRIRMLRPLRRRTDVAQRRLRHGVYLLPSMFTLANMFCGYACIVYAMRGEFITAAPFIGLAIVVDMLDGRIARMTGTHERVWNRVRFTGRHHFVRRGTRHPCVFLGTATARAGWAGRPASSSSPPRRPAWRASTFRRDRTTSAFSWDAEPCGRRCAGGNGVCLPVGVSELP